MPLVSWEMSRGPALEEGGQWYTPDVLDHKEEEKWVSSNWGQM